VLHDVKPAVPPANELERAYTTLIRAAGTTCQRIVQILPPVDSGGEAEVLFLGDGDSPLTAYISDHKGALPLIASGW
jgi:hypothetical protein